MDIQQIKIRIGLVCVAFLAATVVLVMLFGGGKMPDIFSSDYEIYVLLKQAPMLSENSPVYKNGVEIGRVTRVELVNQDREVRITTRIKSNIRLYTDEECNLSLNLLGQSTLNFMPKTTEPLPDMPEPEVLAAKSTIYGVTPIDLLRVADHLQSDATKALRSVTSVADELKVSFGIVNQILGTPEDVAKKQQRIEQIVDQVAQTMTAVSRVLASVDELISDPAVKEGIRISSTQLPGVIDEGKKLMANINGMTDHITRMLNQVDGTIGKIDQNLDNFTEFTKALGEIGPQFLEALASAAEEFDGGMTQLSAFARSLNNPDGSIGQLLNDPEFFQLLKNTMKNADQTVQNLQRVSVQLQPIMQDVNVFTDKLAREPWQLGLRGMFDKSPPTKGIPDAYSNSWQYGRNNGIPHQQSERIQLLRPRTWPLGMPQYRNEPVPQNNRYSSQVIDLPDSPYDVFGFQASGFRSQGGKVEEWESESPYHFPTSPSPHPEVAYPLSFQTPQVAPRNRVVIVPVPPERLQASGKVSVTYTETPKPEARNGMTLEIDFRPDMANAPVRLASGNTSTPPPIIQPMHGTTQTTTSQVIQPSGTVPAKPKSNSEFNIPSFTPVF